MTNSKLKDSNIEWLGKIPSNWKVKPLYLFFFERKNKNNKGKEKNLLSLSYGKIIQKDINSTGGLLPQSYNTYNVIEAGDIIIRPTDLQNDKHSLRTAFSKEHGIITSAYIDLAPLKDTNSEYFHYVLHAYDIEKVFYNMGNGVRQGLNYSEFSKLKLPIPSSEEQKEIVNFLNNQVSQIDKLSKKIQQEITDLEKYRKSIITKAVTTGLNKNIQMKDSNIDYINKMPSTWHLTRLKYILTERNQRSIDGKELLLSVSQKKGVLPAYQVKRSIKANSLVGYKIVKQNDLVFNKLNPALARFGVSNYNGITSPDFSVYYSNKINIQFLSFLLKTSKYVTEYKRLCSGVGEGYTRLYTPTLYNIKVALPTIKEQNKIVNILNKKDQKIKKLMEKQKRLLLTLTQYKQSLIYEYVTGKKQVSSKESAKA